MASKFLRRQRWWIKFRHPATGQTVRESLETPDEARAELLRQRIDLEVALLDPRFQAAEVPNRLRQTLGALPIRDAAAPAAEMILEPAPHPALAPPTPVPRKRATIDETVAAYLRFIASENAPLHFANNVSILRRFLGAERVEKAGGPAKTKRRSLENGKAVPDPAPFFTGTYLDEITPVLAQSFLEGLGVGRKTMRHYREMLHHF